MPPVDPQRLNAAGSVFLTRPTLADYIATTEEFRGRAGEILEGVVDGALRVRTVAPTEAQLAAVEVTGERRDWWLDRLRRLGG